MIKFAVIKSSDLGMACWSAVRFTGRCHECRRVEFCKLIEAVEGREKFLKQKLKKARAVVRKIKNDLSKNKN